MNEKASQNGKSQDVSPKIETHPAIILDLDGTVRRSKSGKEFITGPDDIELMPGIEERLMIFHAGGYVVAGASNQGGVAYGFKSQAQAIAEMNATAALFKANPFHIIKMCYFMEDGNTFPYNHRSLSRKPDYGLLVLIEMEAYMYGHIIDWNKSLFVGDRPEDKQCAANARIQYMDINDFLSLSLQEIASLVNPPPIPTNIEEAVVFLQPYFRKIHDVVAKMDIDGFVKFCHTLPSGDIAGKIHKSFQLDSHTSPIKIYLAEKHNIIIVTEMIDFILRELYRSLKVGTLE